jgi:hypothetical protein
MPSILESIGRPVRVALAVGLAVALSACTPAGRATSPSTTAAAGRSDAAVRGQLVQFRRDVAARRLQVRLTAGAAALTVEGLELRSPSLVARPAVPREGRLAAGSTLDFPVIMAAADCAVRPGAPVAVATLRDDAGARRTIEIPLDDDGLIRRLHATDCADQALRAQAVFDVTGLEPVTTAEGPAMRVDLRLSRVGGGDQVRVIRPEPNTIYDITAVGALPVLRGPGAVPLRVDMVPARCDAHALGESYRTSLIDLFVSLGAGDPQLVTITPAVDVRRRLEKFAVDTCRSAGH